MFGKKIESQVTKTLEEFEEWGFSDTYDGIILDFIDYMVEVIRGGFGTDFLDAYDYLKSDDMKMELDYYMEMYLDMAHKPKYSPDDLVTIPKEQLDKLIKAANR